MPETTGRFGLVPKCLRAATLASLVFLGLLVAATIAVALVAVPSLLEEWTYLVALALLVLAELLAGLWIVVQYGVLRSILSSEAAARQSAGLLDRIETLLEDQTESARKLTELAALSDQAKSLIYRDQETEALRGVSART